MLVSVSVYPFNDNAIPFKINFGSIVEAQDYAKAISHKADTLIQQFPNLVYRELD